MPAPAFPFFPFPRVGEGGNLETTPGVCVGGMSQALLPPPTPHRRFASDR